MITSEMLDDLQAEVSDVGNLLDAMQIIMRELDCPYEDRQPLNGMWGGINAAIRQVEQIHDRFRVLFDALRDVES